MPKCTKNAVGGFVVGILEPRDIQPSLGLRVVSLALVLVLLLIVGIHDRVNYWISNGGMEAH
jgi:hypothetical protein